MRNSRKDATINEVAQRCQVSRTTVSRFLNGRYEYMSPETRSRIQTVVDEMGYRPSNLARSLKSKRSGVIGVVIADITNPFASILIKGIGDFSNQNGYQIMIANCDNDPQKELDIIQAFIDNRVEGLIVNTTGENDERLVALVDSGIPIVLADRPMNELKIDVVTNDNYSMTKRVILHLIDRGFQRVAFFTQEIGKNNARRIRKEAFVDTCNSHLGTACTNFVYEITPSEPHSTTEALSDFINQSNGLTRAIFAVNGVTLLNVARACIQLNLEIPTDIGICGYDDWGWTELIPPGISAVAQPTYQVGMHAAKRLITRLNSKHKMKPKLIELPSTWIERGSTILQM